MDELIRRCPGCGAENPPAAMRCSCGMLLAGVDLSHKAAMQPAPAQDMAPQAAAESLTCPYDDCAQPNPPGSTQCVYCNRPLGGTAEALCSEEMATLVNLPAALKTRYRIVRPMPARGAEAELLVVQENTGGPELIAKIYRHGILPRREVQDRITRIAPAHRVRIMAEGLSDGHAYELMELCEHGSLRELLAAGALAAAQLQVVVRELATALHDVHEVGLVHRDLKPENVLIRTLDPLDLVLTDFSIASILDATQRFTGVARTLPYAAPESLSGVIDSKTDYWALGMLLLEAAQGKHPFEGLSEAVIMHQLTTRNIDLAGVADRNLRKLLLGLLQRDPAQRWGHAEIARWLENDISLAEPLQHNVGDGYREPYHVGAEICHTPAQLAVALARNWKEGRADIANGQLLAWFRDVQKDQNVVRLLIELRGQTSLSVDVQLLRLILQLAPGIPPVWQGETITLERVLRQASAALKGDTEAAWWLEQLYRYRVIENFADAGNAQAAELVQRWHHAADQFNAAWDDKRKKIHDRSAARDPDTVANFDDLVYGRDELQRPPLINMHARLLAMAYDGTWAERLRQRVLGELLGLATQSSWVSELGDPHTLDAPGLLVLEALLPEAKKSVAHQVKKAERLQQENDKEHAALRDDVEHVMASIRMLAADRMAMPAMCDELEPLLEEYFELSARVLAVARTEPAWLELRKKVQRTQTLAQLLQERVHALQEWRTVSAGWLSWPMFGVALLVIIIMPIAIPGIRIWLILAFIALVAWRVSNDYRQMQAIRELGERF